MHDGGQHGALLFYRTSMLVSARTSEMCRRMVRSCDYLFRPFCENPRPNIEMAPWGRVPKVYRIAGSLIPTLPTSRRAEARVAIISSIHGLYSQVDVPPENEVGPDLLTALHGVDQQLHNH